MKFTYNSLPLHELGDLRVLSQRGTLVPPEAPVVRRVELTVRIDFTETNWWLNRVLQNRVTSAIADPHGTILWLNDSLPVTSLTSAEVTAGGRRVFAGRAMLVSHDLPEDANAWGQSQQSVVLTFQYEDPEIETSLFASTFTPDSGPAVELGSVTEFGYSYNATRYSPLHDQRSRAGGTVTIRGMWSPRASQSGDEPAGLGPVTPTLATLRAGIIAQFGAVVTAVNQKRGTLRFGQRPSESPSPVEIFNQMVRVTGFTGQPDQLNRAVPWTLTAEYSLFPNEGGYALAEFTVRTRREMEGGAFLLSVSGQILANSRSAADLKLDSIRAATVPSGAISTGSHEPTEQRIDGPDGEAFIQLTFDEGYRTTRTTGLVRIQYRVDVETDLLALERRTTVRGQVGCASRSEGNTALTSLFGSPEFAGFGTLVKEQRGEARLTDLTGTHLLEFAFGNEYRAALSGQTGILECNVSESVRHTGIRWVIRDTAFGRPLAQACGYLPGSRSVRAQVVAVDEATCRTWIDTQYNLAFHGPTPSPRFRRPPEIGVSWSFAPRITGVARGGGANAQVVRMDLTADEDLLNHDYA